MAVDPRKSAPPPPNQLVVMGASHGSSSLAVRDGLFMEEDALAAFLGKLGAGGLDQALVMSTCDRTEVATLHPQRADAARIIEAALGEASGLGGDALAGQLFVLEGEEALEHMFAVAASLESLVIGEPQVLGQVKTSYRIAQDAQMMGAELDRIMQAAFAAAKRARSETMIGQSAVSIAAAAVQVAKDVHGDLGRATALIVGGGEMGDLVAAKLMDAGLTQLIVTDSVSRRAEAMARRFSCHVAPFALLALTLSDADILLSAVGRGNYVISADMVREALHRRRHRPIFLVDAAIPGDIDPVVDRLDEAFLYGLNDLERIATEGREKREAAAARAWDIVHEEVARFSQGASARDAVPTLVAIRGHFEDVRSQVLADNPGADANEATRLLINRLLHAPSQALRDAALEAGAGNPDAAPGGLERLLRKLFAMGAAEAAADETKKPEE